MTITESTSTGYSAVFACTQAQFMLIMEVGINEFPDFGEYWEQNDEWSFWKGYATTPTYDNEMSAEVAESFITGWLIGRDEDPHGDKIKALKEDIRALGDAITFHSGELSDSQCLLIDAQIELTELEKLA